MLRPNYIFSLHVRDTPGVLMRIAQVFGRRGCNIRSLYVRPSTDCMWSTMTLTVHGVARPEQLRLQLEKLVDVQSAHVQTQDVNEGPRA